MKYIYTKTGVIIDSPCEIFGDDWEKVEEESFSSDSDAISGGIEISETLEEELPKKRGRKAANK